MPAEVVSMMYTGEIPWHKLGTHVEEAPNTKDAIVLGGLDRYIDKVAHYNEYIDTRGAHKDVMGYHVRYHDTPETVIAKVSAGYEVVQNEEVFSIGDYVLGEGLARVETCGVLKGGAVVWMAFRLRDFIEVLPDDRLERYLLATSTHDETGKVRYRPTNYRVVCANTLDMALGHKAEWEFSAVHRAGVHDAIERGKQLVAMVINEGKAEAELWQAMAHHQMSEKDIVSYVHAVYPVTYKPFNTQQVINLTQAAQEAGHSAESIRPLILRGYEDKGSRVARAKVLELVETGKGTDIPGVKGSLWGALNAVTEYESNYVEYKGRNEGVCAEKRLHSTILGDGLSTRLRACEIATRFLSKN